jgi:hypothetical protein
MAEGDAVTEREEFDTADNIVDFPADEDLANLLLPDRVVFLGQLGHIAMIGLECLV